MSIIGEKPEHGIRVRLERAASATSYEGTATTSDAQWKISVAVDDEGEVDVASDAPDDVRERVRLMVRIEARNARASGIRMPRVIQRWRAPKE